MKPRNTNLAPSRAEVMRALEGCVDEVTSDYLAPVEQCWQPSDLLPDPSAPSFLEEVRELQSLAEELNSDFWAVLIGDTITEEALPTYEAWLMDVEGVQQRDENSWAKWIRHWTAEENRHGDLLNRYLYLSGMVNMKEVERSTQYLLADGFDIGTARDPYRNFVYTSFQEIATNVSHRRVASLAKAHDNPQLAKICGTIAADEARHARAYKQFVTRIFEIDPSQMMLAFEDMMRKRIVMPAAMLRETGGNAGELFTHFSDAAQRLRVYTTDDYIHIFESLLEDWSIETVSELNDPAEQARDFLVALPNRLRRIARRLKASEKPYSFKWLA